jgi:single-strand DNA-binding protein
MINRVVLTGNLTKDPELKTTQSGLSVVQFVIGVQRQFARKDGEREADFISCVAWRKTAKNIARYFKKGQLIGIDGRVQTRSYDDKNGQRVYVTEVVVDNFAFLSSQKGQGNRNPSQRPNTTAQDPFAGTSNIDITDDDLPF